MITSALIKRLQAFSLLRAELYDSAQRCVFTRELNVRIDRLEHEMKVTVHDLLKSLEISDHYAAELGTFAAPLTEQEARSMAGWIDRG